MKYFFMLTLILIFTLHTFEADAGTVQDFEDGALTGWTVGGRQLGTPNSVGVSSYAGSMMAYLSHGSFTELTLTKTFNYTIGINNFSFDAEFSVNGNNSVTPSSGSSYYSMAGYNINLYDQSGTLLGNELFMAATSTFPYNNGWTQITPDGVTNYKYDISQFAAGLGVLDTDIYTFDLTFRGYSSWWSGDTTMVRFDNVGFAPAAVPEPATIALLGIGLVGLAGAEVRRRRKKNAVDKS